MEVLPKLPRPVLISFTREGPGQPGGSPGGLAAAARLASSPSRDAQVKTDMALFGLQC